MSDEKQPDNVKQAEEAGSSEQKKNNSDQKEDNSESNKSSSESSFQKLIFPKLFIRPFKSESKDAGVAYVENFLRRKVTTMNIIDITRALLNAAEKGSPDRKISNLVFVSDLMKSNSSFFLKLSKEERHKIFVRASEVDKERERETNLYPDQQK